MKQITDEEIELLKGQVSATEQSYRSPSATLVMRPGGNEYKRIPSLVDKAKNLASTALAASQGVLEGKSLIAPDAMIENRLSICKACPYGGGEVFCRSCGCITAAKVRIAASHCPEGKWRSL